MLYHIPKANQRKKKKRNIEDEIQLESPQKTVDLKSDIRAFTFYGKGFNVSTKTKIVRLAAKSSPVHHV